MTTLNVGAGQTYKTIAAAVNAAADGDTVLVQAGTYTNDFITVTHKITMKSVGGMAILAATSSPPNGKAILTADASLTIDGFGFTGASVGDANGAGIRMEAGDLVVRNSVFWDNQDGILATAPVTSTILIDNSEFSHNGAGDGQSHNIYIGGLASAVIQNSYFHDAVVGHEIKSRALNNTITGNRIFDNTGNASYSIDLPQGGNATVTNNIIEKGPNAPNWISIHFGGEVNPYEKSSLVVSGNTLINDNANGYLLTNSLTDATVSLTGNQIWGYQDSHLTLGTVNVGTNTTLSARPTLDLSSIAPAVPLPVTAPPVIETPASATTYLDFGRAGAVTASGRILTVGAQGQFGTLATALFAAKDGDTIQVAAGTYTNDFGVVTKKVIIEGVGGIARFTESSDLSDIPSAILTVSADATIRNIEVTGAAITGHQPGLRVTAGHVTLVNTLLDGNDIGLWADSNPDTTLSVYDSEIGSNGNVYKGTNNIQIYQIGSFTLQNSYVHGAVSGHEIADFAFNSVIQGNRIIDGAGIPASFLIDLGQGGNALIQGNLLDKGKDTANGVLIHVGGEGTLYDNSNVRILGNTLASELPATAGHPYTYFIVNDTTKGTVPLTVDGNLFVGGIPGSVQVTNGTGTNNTTATTTPLDTSSPVDPALAPAYTPAPPGPNVLTLTMTEVFAQIDAQYIVSVDGVDIGGGVITAREGVDSPQTATFTGSWGAGAHTVAVRSTNVFWKVAPAAGGLNIKSVSLDGNVISPGAQLVPSSTTWSGTLLGNAVPATQPPPDTEAVVYPAPDTMTDAPPTTLVAPGKDYLNTGTTAQIVRAGDGALTIWMQNANGMPVLGQTLTAQGAFFTIDSATTVLGGGQDFFHNGGRTLFLRDGAGALIAQGFDAGGAAVARLPISASGAPFTLDSAASIVGAGADYFRNGTRTVFVRSADGTLTAWGVSADGTMVAARSLVADGTPLSIDSSAMVLDAGEDYFHTGAYSLFIRDGGGALHVWGFDTSGQRISATDLTLSGTPLMLDSATTIIGGGQDYFGNGGRTVFIEGGGGALHGWSFDAGGALNGGIDFTQAGASLITKGSSVVGAGGTFFGNGDNTLFVRDSDGALHALGANATGAIDTSMDFSFSSSHVAIDTATTVAGGGQDFFGNGGRTVFVRGGDGWLHGWSFNSSGTINAGMDFGGPGTQFTLDSSATIVGAGSDYFGNGERALFIRGQDGSLSVASFRNDASLDIRQAFTLDGTSSLALDPGARITGTLNQGATHGIYVQDQSGANHVWTFDSHGLRTGAT